MELPRTRRHLAWQGYILRKVDGVNKKKIHYMHVESRWGIKNKLKEQNQFSITASCEGNVILTVWGKFKSLYTYDHIMLKWFRVKALDTWNKQEKLSLFEKQWMRSLGWVLSLCENVSQRQYKANSKLYNFILVLHRMVGRPYKDPVLASYIACLSWK